MNEHESHPDIRDIRDTRTTGATTPHAPERFDVVVIGGGQAGLVTGYYLQKRGLSFVILDASERVGDSWRRRWDTLRLFTPARYDGLDGMPFPAPPTYLPTKDEMADYLETYAKHFALPVRLGVRVQNVSRRDGRFTVTTTAGRFEAPQVVVAMGNFQRKRVPDFARELGADIVQLHSSEYKSVSQLKQGGVLLVGAGNSGAELAMETIKHHPTWLVGRSTGHVPFRIDGFWGRHLLTRLLLGVVFHYVLTVHTAIGRKARARMMRGGGPLIRQQPRDLARAGVQRAGRVVGVQGGLPLLEDGRMLDVRNVIWCTGFTPGLSWLDLPVFDAQGQLRHDLGVAGDVPNLYFVGLAFQYAMSSVMIRGVSRDAARIAGQVATEHARESGAAREPAAAPAVIAA